MTVFLVMIFCHFYTSPQHFSEILLSVRLTPDYSEGSWVSHSGLEGVHVQGGMRDVCGRTHRATLPHLPHTVHLGGTVDRICRTLRPCILFLRLLTSLLHYPILCVLRDLFLFLPLLRVRIVHSQMPRDFLFSRVLFLPVHVVSIGFDIFLSLSEPVEVTHAITPVS